MVLPKIQEMSSTLIDAARDLGASQWDVLTKVVIPYITPGIFAGFFMALTYSLDDFAVTFFVTGNGFYNSYLLKFTLWQDVEYH